MMPSLTTNTGLTGHDAGPSDQNNWNTHYRPLRMPFKVWSRRHRSFNHLGANGSNQPEPWFNGKHPQVTGKSPQQHRLSRSSQIVVHGAAGTTLSTRPLGLSVGRGIPPSGPGGATRSRAGPTGD